MYSFSTVMQRKKKCNFIHTCTFINFDISYVMHPVQMRDSNVLDVG